MGGPEVPALECGFCIIEIPEREDLIEREFHMVPSSGTAVPRGQRSDHGTLLISCGIGIMEPRVPRPLELGHVLLLFSAHRIERLIDDLRNMEAIEGDLGIREVLPHSIDERRGEVDDRIAHLFGIATMEEEILGKSLNGGRILPRGDEEHAIRIEVGTDGDIVVSFRSGGLINADGSDTRHIHTISGLSDVVLNDAHEPGIVLPGDLLEDEERHGLGEVDDERLEEECEPGTRARPRHRHCRRFPTVIALDARNRGVEVRLVLEEIEMAPYSLPMVVDTAGIMTSRTREGCACGIRHRDIEASIVFGEKDLLDGPWIIESERLLEDGEVV